MQATRIQELKAKLMESAALVQQMVSLSLSHLAPGGINSFDEVMALENRVNYLEMSIDALSIKLIALFQPEAKDLRRILMMYRINSDLERLGDQAVNIAESACKLSATDIEEQDIWLMQEATLEMLSQCIKAFLTEDTEAAKAVCANDNIVDDLNRKIYTQVVQHIKADPENAEKYLHLLRIAKNLERVADLATNIAESTVYLAHGKVIKHNLDQS